MCILIAHDDPLVRDVVRRYLERDGRTVVATSDGVSTLAQHFGDLSTVTVHIKRLRAKLGARHRIETVWGRDYIWGRNGESSA